MGQSRFNSADWNSYSSVTSTRTVNQNFTSRNMKKDLDPMNINVRESRDSDDNPNSTAIMVTCDVTGSMGMIAQNLITEGLGVLFKEIYERQPVSDPHIMVLANGDAATDKAPLQAGEFEADVDALTSQLEQIYVEGNGGGNGQESYDLPVYFAAYKTSIDCFEKRQKKGYLFTIGDENPPSQTKVHELKKVFGEDSIEATVDVPFSETIKAAEEMYEYYHIIVAEGWFASRNLDTVKAKWQDLLGERAIVISDYTKLSEVIVSAIEVNEGATVDAVASSWGGDTSLVVADAIKDLTANGKTDAAMSAVTRL